MRFSTRERIFPKIIHSLCTRSRTCTPASSRSKNFKEYRFEWAQNEWPARSAHMSRAGPDTDNIETKKSVTSLRSYSSRKPNLSFIYQNCAFCLLNIDYYSLLSIGIIYSLITAARYCTASFVRLFLICRLQQALITRTVALTSDCIMSYFMLKAQLYYCVYAHYLFQPERVLHREHSKNNNHRNEV